MRLEYAFHDEYQLYLIMEFVNGGELFTHLQQKRTKDSGFEEPLAQFYAAQMVLALEYLHIQGVVYRDFKPENILIDSAGYIRLTDFGLSKVGMNEVGRTKTFCGTLEYMAPEMIRNSDYDQSVDWFSFGLVLFEMIRGRPPFKFRKDQTVVEKMNIILKEEPQIPENCSPEASDLLSKLLKHEPTERIGCWEGGALDVK